MLKKSICAKVILCACLLFFSITSLVFAETYNIEGCYPDALVQGSKDAVITIATKTPLPQKTLDEFLYSSIYFSNPGVHIKKVSFQNAYVMTCVIDIDKDAPLSEDTNPVNVNIVSYDENGVPYDFIGQNMFKIKRKPFVEEIIIDNSIGKIIKGDKAKITLKGKNFVPGTFGVLLMWTGLPRYDVECLKEDEVVLNISAEDTVKLKPGAYGVYVYNFDGSANQSDIKVEITE